MGWTSSRSFGVNMKNVWNHQLASYWAFVHIEFPLRFRNPGLKGSMNNKNACLPPQAPKQPACFLGFEWDEYIN